MKDVSIERRPPLTIQGMLRERIRIAADQITIGASGRVASTIVVYSNGHAMFSVSKNAASRQADAELKGDRGPAG